LEERLKIKKIHACRQAGLRLVIEKTEVSWEMGRILAKKKLDARTEPSKNFSL